MDRPHEGLVVPARQLGEQLRPPIFLPWVAEVAEVAGVFGVAPDLRAAVGGQAQDEPDQDWGAGLGLGASAHPCPYSFHTPLLKVHLLRRLECPRAKPIDDKTRHLKGPLAVPFEIF